jgi:anaerobic magnesium-protoporphyrin IX monomethyl ester cyclase
MVIEPRKRNVVFVHLPSVPLDQMEQVFADRHAPDFSYIITMPLGILYVSSYLKEHGSNVGEVGLIDFPPKLKDLLNYQNIEDFIHSAAVTDCNFTPDIIAISTLFSSAHQFLLKASKVLKSRWPNATIVVGGIHATSCTSELLANENIDYVCRGEGEIAFTNFVNSFDTPARDQIPGMIKAIHPDNNYSLSELADDLDVLPYPDWSLLEMPLYVRETSRSLARNGGRFEENPAAIIMTTRGCPFSCTFCASHTVHGRKLRFRSVENVLGEVRILYEQFGVSTIIPEDDLFTGNRKKVIELLTAFEHIGIPNFSLHFPNALSVNTLHDDVMDALIRAGMKVTSIAIESGDNEVQRNIIKKRVNLKRAPEVIKYLKDRGVIARCFFILGFPGETREQMNETIAYAKSLGADWCFFGVAVPLIGSEMYEQLIEMNYIQADTNLWSNTVYGTRIYETKEITGKDLESLAYRTNLDVNFLNNVNFRDGAYDRVIEIFNDILVKYPFHIFAEYCLVRAYHLKLDAELAESHLKNLISLIATDRRSRKMWEQYSDLLPDIREIIEGIDLDDFEMNEARHISDRMALRFEQSLSLSAA